MYLKAWWDYQQIKRACLSWMFPIWWLSLKGVQQGYKTPAVRLQKDKRTPEPNCHGENSHGTYTATPASWTSENLSLLERVGVSQNSGHVLKINVDHKIQSPASWSSAKMLQIPACPKTGQSGQLYPGAQPVRRSTKQPGGAADTWNPRNPRTP